MSTNFIVKVLEVLLSVKSLAIMFRTPLRCERLCQLTNLLPKSNINTKRKYAYRILHRHRHILLRKHVVKL